MNRVRENGEVTIGRVKAVKVGGGAGGTKNPLVPDVVEFLCDVTIAVKAILPRDITLKKFTIAYMIPVTDDVIEREQFAQFILKDRRHSAEQRAGAEFIRRNIFPLTKYMTAPRKPRPRGAL